MMMYVVRSLSSKKSKIQSCLSSGRLLALNLNFITLIAFTEFTNEHEIVEKSHYD